MANCKTCSHVDVCGYAFDEDERRATVYCSDYQERDRCDREALLNLADELDEVQHYLTSGKMMDPQDAEKRIREACGKDDK